MNRLHYAVPVLLLAALSMAGCKTDTTKTTDAHKHTVKMATQKQADAALAFLKNKLPNTPFTIAVPSRSAPGYVRVGEASSSAPVYFDPRTKYMIIGLVVNFGDKDMRIAGGASMLGANRMSLPEKQTYPAEDK